MNQLRSDLEQNLIDEDNYYDEHHSNLEVPYQEEAERIPEQNVVQTATNDLDSSPRFNILSLVVSGSKIIVSTVILIMMSHTCISLSEIWIFCMLAHDMLYILTVAMRLKNVYALRNINYFPIEPLDAVEPIYVGTHQGLHDRELRPADQEAGQPQDNAPQEQNQPSEDDIRAGNKILERARIIKLLAHACLWFWSALFVTGICLNAFMDLTVCETPETNHLLLAYLILAGIWLFSPVLLLLIGCVCLPVLVIIIWMLGRPKPANQAAIKKLPIVKYSNELPGEKECIICMIEYQPGDKLVQLRCNQMHYFHEKCGKKWLRINGQCPMCRVRIDQKSENSSTQARGSERSNQDIQRP